MANSSIFLNSERITPEEAVYETEAYIDGYADGKNGKNIGKVGAIKAYMTWDDKVESVFGGRPFHKGKEVEFKIGESIPFGLAIFNNAAIGHGQSNFLTMEIE